MSLTFLALIRLLTETGAFLIYFGFALLGLIYFSIYLPETKGKTLEEIEKLFQDKEKSDLPNHQPSSQTDESSEE